MSRVQAIVFDLDDTLYLERSFALSGFDAVSRGFEAELGDPADAAGKMRSLFDSDDRPRVFNAILADRGLAEDATMVRRMIDVYRSHVPNIALIDDADAVLARVGDRYKLGLITDGPSHQQGAKVDALGLRDRIHEIVLTGDLGDSFGKPHPRAYELVAQRMGVDHKYCVYVADNPAKDFVAPNALGWLTIRIKRPGGIYGDVRPAAHGRPKHVITTLDDLDDLLA